MVSLKEMLHVNPSILSMVDLKFNALILIGYFGMYGNGSFSFPDLPNAFPPINVIVRSPSCGFFMI